MQRAAPKARVNNILLARFEQWALPRMARRLPGWVTPDMLTALGLLASLLIGAAYLFTHFSLAWLWLASVGFVIHWWADSLDGTLARVRDIRRERYGFYVDHQADAVSVLVIFAGLGFSPLMPLSVALFLVAGYYMMMILVNLVAIARNVFKISFGGLGPTEARIAMIAANTAVFFLNNREVAVLGVEISLFEAIGVAGGTVLVGSYAVFSLIERSRLARLDPTPMPGDSSPDIAPVSHPLRDVEPARSAPAPEGSGGHHRDGASVWT
jgi:archaetidylinositol phosphate synthase